MFRLGVKEDQNIVAKPYVLCASSYVEADFSRPLACVAAVHLQQLILHGKTGELLLHRRSFNHGNVCPAIAHITFRQRHGWGGTPRRTNIDVSAVWAGGGKRRGNPSPIDDLHQEKA